jgi:isoleucine--tRNA ligase
VDIYSEDIPGWLVANEGTLTIALDITVTDDLRLEGTARELINRIQNLRKQSGFEVSDRIRVLLPEDEELAKVLALYGSYIAREVQAVSIDQRAGFTPLLEMDLDDRLIPIYIERENI